MVKLRALQAGDGESIHKILEHSRRASKIPIGPEWSQTQIVSECAEAAGLVAESKDGGALAFILYRDVGEAWEISFLATDPEARGQGLMVRLLKVMIEQKPMDRAIWLEVHEHNGPALNLYAKVGFREVGRRPKYYKDGGAAVLFSYAGAEG